LNGERAVQQDCTALDLHQTPQKKEAAMVYKVVFPVEHNLKMFGIDAQISFTKDEEAERDALLERGAIRELLNEEARATASPEPDDLAVLGVKALLAIVAAEGATVPEKANKAALVDAIEARRIEVAAAALGNGDPATALGAAAS
jgi:hypothetical protein